MSIVKPPFLVQCLDPDGRPRYSWREMTYPGRVGVERTIWSVGTFVRDISRIEVVGDGMRDSWPFYYWDVRLYGENTWGDWDMIGGWLHCTEPTPDAVKRDARFDHRATSMIAKRLTCVDPSPTQFIVFDFTIESAPEPAA